MKTTTKTTISKAPSPTAPPMELEERLHLLHLAFEAAIAALPRPALSHAALTPTKHGAPPILRLKTNPSGRANAVPPGTPRQFIRAYSRHQTCDFACCLLEPLLETLLNGSSFSSSSRLTPLAATIQWVTLARVTPAFLIQLDDAAPPTKSLNHSVLRVTDAQGNDFALDVAGEQFGWPRGKWLRPWSEFVGECCWGGKTPSSSKKQHKLYVAGGVMREEVEEKMEMEDCGFFAVVGRRLGEVVREVDWVALGGMSPVERRWVFGRGVERKLEGAWNEAFEGERRRREEEEERERERWARLERMGYGR